MGSRSSTLIKHQQVQIPLQNHDPGNPFFIVHMSDKVVRLAMSSSDVIQVFRECILDHWSRGIHEENDNEFEGYTIEFKGNPFSDRGPNTLRETEEIKLTFQHIFLELYKMGYELIIFCELSPIRDAYSCTLFFQMLFPPRNTPSMFCLSITGYDTLQIIGTDDQEVIDLIGDTVKEVCGELESENSERPKCHQMRVWSNPWLGEKGVGRKLLLTIFTRLHAIKYRLHAKVNMESAHAIQSKTKSDTMFFIRDDASDPSLSQSQLCMISLNGYGQLRTTDCNRSAAGDIENCLARFWPKWVEKEKILDDPVTEYFLEYRPWMAWKEGSVEASFFMLNVISTLLSKGWCILTSLDINNTSNTDDILNNSCDKSLLIFRQCPPVNGFHCCISFKHFELQLINVPVDLQEKLLTLFQTSRQGGATLHKGELYSCINFGTRIFDPTNNENRCMMGQVLACQILRLSLENGWCLIESIGKSDEQKSFDDTICDWFFRKMPEA